MLAIRQLSMAGVVAAILALGGSLASGEDPAEKTPEGVSSLLEWIAREHLPKEIDDSKHWGKEEKVWAGVRVSWDSDGLHTKRKWDSVRQGTWYRYRAELVDPDRRLQIQVGKLRELPQGRAGFDVVAKARMAATGRMAQWQTNVQILSVGVEAEADIELRLKCSTGFQLDAKKFPPDVLIDMRVDEAELRLVELRLEKFGVLENGAARLLGRSLRTTIEEKLEKGADKLAAKMNAKLQDPAKKPRLALSELTGSGWDSWVGKGASQEEERETEPTKKQETEK